MFYVPMLYAWMCKSDGVKLFTYYAVLALLVALAFFIYPMSSTSSLPSASVCLKRATPSISRSAPNR